MTYQRPSPKLLLSALSIAFIAVRTSADCAAETAALGDAATPTPEFSADATSTPEGCNVDMSNGIVDSNCDFTDAAAKTGCKDAGGAFYELSQVVDGDDCTIEIPNLGSMKFAYTVAGVPVCVGESCDINDTIDAVQQSVPSNCNSQINVIHSPTESTAESSAAAFGSVALLGAIASAFWMSI